MSAPHAVLDALDAEDARQALGRCCAARRWVERMLDLRPFASDEDLYQAAERVWSGLEAPDFLEAFAAHPRIGEDPVELCKRFQTTAAWSEGEQAGVEEADARTLEALRAANVRYRERFGFIFIVCATGKSAHEMLGLLEARLRNEPGVELGVAAAEQAKITRLRLEKLV